MDLKYIVYILIAVAIILAVILKGETIVSFMGLKLNTKNSKRKNQAYITGDSNKVKQGGNTKNSTANNSARIKGGNNDVEQH